jgi:hypothetical protein
VMSFAADLEPFGQMSMSSNTESVPTFAACCCTRRGFVQRPSQAQNRRPLSYGILRADDGTRNRAPNLGKALRAFASPGAIAGDLRERFATVPPGPPPFTTSRGPAAARAHHSAAPPPSPSKRDLSRSPTLSLA